MSDNSKKIEELEKMKKELKDNENIFDKEKLKDLDLPKEVGPDLDLSRLHEFDLDKIILPEQVGKKHK